MDQCRTKIGEDKGSILLKVGFFFLLIHFVKKMLVNIIILILILFTGISKLLSKLNSKTDIC